MTLAGDRVRGARATRPATGVLLARLVGAILLATAFYTALEGLRMR